MSTYIQYLFLLLFLSLTACESPTNISFFTEGNCPECEGHIIEALTSQEGVREVSWDMESSKTTVSYYASEIDSDQIQEAIAAAGFVVQLFPPNEETRANLPACCRQQIDRKLKQELAPH